MSAAHIRPVKSSLNDLLSTPRSNTALNGRSLAFGLEVMELTVTIPKNKTLPE